MFRRHAPYNLTHRFKRQVFLNALAALLLSVPLSLAFSQEQSSVLDIGSRRELFVDSHLIDRLENARLMLHEPRREEIALKFNMPWEGVFSAYITVIKDAELYRMYYRGRPSTVQEGMPAEVTCYAESKNGKSWIKPSLKLFEVAGSRDNNVILVEAPFCHNFSPFLDTRPGVAQTERYKALAGTGASGLHAFVSGDGIRWKKQGNQPVITEGAFDSQNVAFWSSSEKCYVCYFRTWKQVGEKNYRWISRTTSPNFTTWSKPVEMNHGDAPPEELYTNGTHPYFRAPHIYIALAKRFFPGKIALPPEEAATLVENPSYRAASSDSVFMTSRGGDRYDRTFMEAFIRPGPSPRDWICRDNAPALGVVPVDDREMVLYRLSHYAQPTCHLMQYALRLDGFVSVHAPLEGGEVVTKLLSFTGNTLEINYATSAAGGIRVEIQDMGGKPIQDFSLDDCTLIFGDQIERTVSWKKGSDIESLSGKPVRLRFVLNDADLYAFRFK